MPNSRLAVSAYLRPVEVLPADAQVSSDSVDRACGQVPIAVSWDGGFPVICRVNPDLVGTSALAVEHASKPCKFPGQFPVRHTATESLPSPAGDGIIPAGRGLPRSL